MSYVSSAAEKVNPWSYDMNVKTGSVGAIVTALAIITALAGVLAILTASGVPLGVLNSFSVLTNGGGAALLVVGSALSAVGLAWIVTQSIKKYRKETPDLLEEVKDPKGKERAEEIVDEPPSVTPSTPKPTLTTYACGKKGFVEKLTHQLQRALMVGHGSPKGFSLDVDISERSLTVSTKDRGVGAAKTAGNNLAVPFTVSITLSKTLIFTTHSVKLIGLCYGYKDEGIVGNYIKENLPQKLKKVGTKTTNDEGFVNAMTQALAEINQEIIEKNLHREGASTFMGAFVVGGRIYVVNIGDNRAILCKKETAFQLSEDAVLGNERFYRGLAKLNSKLSPRGSNDPRVARVLGRNNYPARPKITKIEKGDSKVTDDPVSGKIYFSKGNYLVLASGKFWNYASNDEVRSVMKAMDATKESPEQMARYLVNSVLKKNPKEQVSVMVYKID